MSRVQRGASSPKKTPKFTAESPAQVLRHLGGLWEKCQKAGDREIVSCFSNKEKCDVQKLQPCMLKGNHCDKRDECGCQWPDLCQAPPQAPWVGSYRRQGPAFKELAICWGSETYSTLRSEETGGPICLRISWKAS